MSFSAHDDLSTISSPDIRRGDLITVTYEKREFGVIVIDPDGLGPGQPSVGSGS